MNVRFCWRYEGLLKDPSRTALAREGGQGGGGGGNACVCPVPCAQVRGGLAPLVGAGPALRLGERGSVWGAVWIAGPRSWWRAPEVCLATQHLLWGGVWGGGAGQMGLRTVPRSHSFFEGLCC